MKWLWSILFVWVFCISTQARIWTNNEGNVTEADLVRVKGKYVFLKLVKNRQIHRVEIKTLSDEDQDFIKEGQALAEAKEKEKKNLPRKPKDFTSASITAKHILVGTKQKARQIMKRMDAGESFADLAAEYSQCPSKQQGGSLGTFKTGQMVPAFEEACLSALLHEVVGPVKTQFGYHLILVTERTYFD